MQSDWKNTFRKDVSEKMKAAASEYALFQKTGSTLYLQQAGNKLFSAVENYLMLKHNKKARNYQHLKQLIAHSPEDKQLLTDAVQLHYFFYNAQLQMETDEAEVFYHRVLEKMTNVLV